MSRHYFDYAAATPLDPEVAKVMTAASQLVGNPSSLHAEGRAVRHCLETARSEIAASCNARSEEIILTSSATESNNLAIFGVLTAAGVSDGEVISLATEHLASKRPCEVIAASGHTVQWAPIDESGFVNAAAVSKLVTDNTILITISLATSEIGSLQPVSEICRVVSKIRLDRRSRGVDTPLLVHTDAASAVGLVSIAVDKLGVDLMTISAAKIYGPAGAAALYVRKGTALTPLIIGGGQERSLRAGTENVAAITGFAAALQQAEAQRKAEVTRLTALRESLWEQLAKLPGLQRNSPSQRCLANLLNVSCEGHDGEDLVLKLDAAGIAVATGAACVASSHQPSHVLLALGYDTERAQSSLRISLGRQTTAASLTALVKALADILKA